MKIDIGFDAVEINGHRIDQEIGVHTLAAIVGTPPRSYKYSGGFMIHNWDDLGFSALEYAPWQDEYRPGQIRSFNFFPVGKSHTENRPGEDVPTGLYTGAMSFSKCLPVNQEWISMRTEPGPSEQYSIVWLPRLSGMIGIILVVDRESLTIDTIFVHLVSHEERAKVGTLMALEPQEQPRFRLVGYLSGLSESCGSDQRLMITRSGSEPEYYRWDQITNVYCKLASRGSVLDFMRKTKITPQNLLRMFLQKMKGEHEPCPTHVILLTTPRGDVELLIGQSYVGVDILGELSGHYDENDSVRRSVISLAYACHCYSLIARGSGSSGSEMKVAPDDSVQQRRDLSAGQLTSDDASRRVPQVPKFRIHNHLLAWLIPTNWLFLPFRSIEVEGDKLIIKHGLFPRKRTVHYLTEISQFDDVTLPALGWLLGGTLNVGVRASTVGPLKLRWISNPRHVQRRLEEARRIAYSRRSALPNY